jgi:hypothetical protein
VGPRTYPDRPARSPALYRLSYHGEVESYSVNKFPPFMELEVSLPVQESPPLVPILREMNPVHTFAPISLRSILILSSNVRLGFTSDL